MQHENHGFSQFITQPPDDFHHVGGVVNVQVIGRLIQQDVFRILCNDHGYVGALALAAGQFVNEPVLKFLQFHVGDGLFDDFLILSRNPIAAVGKATEGHQLPDCQFHLDVVALSQNGQPPGQIPALPFGHVLSLEIHRTVILCDQPGDHSHNR